MWITPHASHKTVAMTLLADKPTLAFFGADSPGKTHCLDCCLVSGVLWCIHVSSTVTNRRKNSSLLRLNNAKHSIEVVTRLRLWSIVSKRGTHLADSFFIPKWSFKIETTDPCDMPMAYTISRTFNLRSANTILRIFSIVSGIATSTGRPERSASIVLVRPQRNSVNHFFTIDIDGAESP